jgi:hypothetical protein
VPISRTSEVLIRHAGSVDDDASLLVSFGGRPFPASALSAPDGAETAQDGPSTALRMILADPRAVAALPQQGWRRLYVGDRRAAFSVPQGLGWATIVVSRAPDGTWGFAGLSRGGPPRRYREGAGPARWRLAPGRAAPTEESGAIAVLVTELACTSGQHCDDRLLAPEVEFRSDSVDITFFVRSLPLGRYRCPGNPPCAVVVELHEPLGHRQLRDGCTHPPRNPADPWV